MELRAAGGPRGHGRADNCRPDRGQFGRAD
jgi:hypothetical protein